MFKLSILLHFLKDQVIWSNFNWKIIAQKNKWAQGFIKIIVFAIW